MDPVDLIDQKEKIKQEQQAMLTFDSITPLMLNFSDWDIGSCSGEGHGWTSEHTNKVYLQPIRPRAR